MAAAAILALVIWVPIRQTRKLDREKDDKRFLAENEARKTLAQIVGGVAILAGLYFTDETLKISAGQNRLAVAQAELAGKQLQLSIAGQITDRFTKATDQIGSGSVAVRIGGILAFDRLSKDTDNGDFWHVMALLATWVKSSSPWPPGKATMNKIPPDIQTAMDVIGFRDPKRDDKDSRLDLSDSDLRKAYLYLTHLDDIDFSNSHLEGADLSEATFDDSVLTGAHLNGADLGGAHLKGCTVTTAELAVALGNKDTELPDGVARPKNKNWTP